MIIIDASGPRPPKQKLGEHLRLVEEMTTAALREHADLAGHFGPDSVLRELVHEHTQELVRVLNRQSAQFSTAFAAITKQIT